MNNFIIDNFSTGDPIKINCSGHLIEGTIVSLDDYYLEIKDKSGEIYQVQGTVTQNFRVIPSNKKNSSASNDSTVVPKELDNNRNDSNTILFKTDSEKNIRSGLKIVGKIDIPKKSWSKEKGKKGFLPYDGEIIAYKKEWDYCFVNNYSNNTIDRVHLKMEDFIDEQDLDKNGKLRKGLPVHYFLYNDNTGYHAHVAFHELPVEKFLDECRNSDIEREREESELYVLNKIDTLVSAGDTDAAFSLIIRISEDHYSDESFRRAVIYKQINYAQREKDYKLAIFGYQQLISSLHLSNFEKSSMYCEIVKLQIADGQDRENIEANIQYAVEFNPQNIEAIELQKYVKQMPRKEWQNDNDLLLDEEDELSVPSVLISKDPNAMDAFGELINDDTNIGLYRKKALELATRRGNTFFEQFKNNIQHATIEQLDLIADSATSYYMEALRCSESDDQNILEIITKILTIYITRYNLSLGKKSIDSYTINKVVNEAFKNSDTEYRNVILKFLISIAAINSNVWNKLLKTKDGLEGLYNLAFRKDIRYKTYELIDAIEGNFNDNESLLSPYEFLKLTIAEKKRKKESLRNLQSNITLDVMAMDSVIDTITQIDQLIYVLPPSDRELYKNLIAICEMLQSYKTSLAQQRLDILHDSRRKLDDCINKATTYPTFFGRTFFFPIFTRWRNTLSTNIESRTALLLPKFHIQADPPFITKSERGVGVNIIIQNAGKSESFGYRMTYTFTTEDTSIESIVKQFESSDTIEPDGRIPEFVVIPDEFISLDSVKLEIEITAKVHGKTLKPEKFAWTLTEEISAKELMNADNIKWSINVKARKEMFKGRERELMELWEHYTTISEMDRPIILYGLTRMGKSSILIALAERIKGTPIELDGKELTIMPFFWELNDIAKQETENGAWDALLYQRLYLQLVRYSSEIDKRTNKPYNFKVKDCQNRLKAQHFEQVLSLIRDAGVYPMIFVDEYSYMRDLIAGQNKTWNLGVGFAQTLRDYSFNRKASFIYAGTYDVRDLVKDERYGCLGGAYAGYIQRHVSGIDREPSEELMKVMEPDVQFTREALNFLHTLSGDVPYFVQMICMNCAKYAIANHRRIIGFPELQYVSDILTSHQKANKKNYVVTPLSDTDFIGNLYDISKKNEHLFYSCIVKLAKVKNNITDYVSLSDISSIWKVNNLSESDQELKNARDALLEKQILEKRVDEDEVYYRIKVDLFRRWWSKYKEEDINYLKKN